MNGDQHRERIFISYRRDDARGASGRLFDWLRIAFGKDKIFRDVASIGVGKWRDKIDTALAQSAVCLAVIGPRWANTDNLPRLQDKNDMVRHELLTALGSDGITLVPTLVEGVQVKDLPVNQLPFELKPLFDIWNAYTVTEGGWEDDTRRLIGDIASATGMAVGSDLETLLRTVSDAQERVADLEQTRQLQTDQIDALRRTVDDLRTKLAASPDVERPGLVAAFAALARGDSLAAEDAFEQEYEVQSRLAEEVRSTRAEAARNVANLALMRDVAKAVSFYRKAIAIEPENSETARLLGHALILLGDIKGSYEAFSESLRVARRNIDLWGEMAAQIGLGDVFIASGNLSAAKKAYSSAMQLAEQRLVRDPANTEWQRDLSISLNKIGDVLVAQGDGPGALDAYRKSLSIREALAARDPANVTWQTDVAVSCAKLGTITHVQSIEIRRGNLIRGKDILLKLKSKQLLMPNKDWIEWFDEQLRNLPQGLS